MIILGVDPGLQITGYGVIEVCAPRREVNPVPKRKGGVSFGFAFRNGVKLKEAGVIRTKPADGISARLEKIYSNLSDVVREYKPKAIVLEKLYSHYKHPVTSILMGHARGVACLVAGSSGVKLINYPSTRIKKAVTGRGHASKLQVQGMVKELLGLKNKPEPMDVADALACALTYVNVELR